MPTEQKNPTSVWENTGSWAPVGGTFPGIFTDSSDSTYSEPPAAFQNLLFEFADITDGGTLTALTVTIRVHSGTWWQRAHDGASSYLTSSSVLSLPDHVIGEFTYNWFTHSTPIDTIAKFNAARFGAYVNWGGATPAWFEIKASVTYEPPGEDYWFLIG